MALTILRLAEPAAMTAVVTWKALASGSSCEATPTFPLDRCYATCYHG